MARPIAIFFKHIEFRGEATKHNFHVINTPILLKFQKDYLMEHFSQIQIEIAIKYAKSRHYNIGKRNFSLYQLWLRDDIWQDH